MLEMDNDFTGFAERVQKRIDEWQQKKNAIEMKELGEPLFNDYVSAKQRAKDFAVKTSKTLQRHSKEGSRA